MSKLIGILTFHNANNYGAALQAYALQKFLKKTYGEDEVAVIDYKCAGVKKQNSLVAYVKSQGAVRGIIHYLAAHNRIKKINEFCRQNMTLSTHITDKSELSEAVRQFSYIVSGSDQIWNRNWTGGEDTYLQDFHDEHHKKISYAASFGLQQLPEEWKDDYCTLLGHFSSISVREESGNTIVNSLLGKQCEVHLDPTLLLKKSSWDELAAAKKNHKKYILVYMVPYQKSVYEKAKELADSTGSELYVICKSLKHIFSSYRGNLTVNEVLAMFRDASYVFTNSFHGTAFSVIYQKNFFVELNNKRGYNIRSAQLIKKCGICDFSDYPDSIECFDVDWQRVGEVIDAERNHTRAYFNSIIKGNN